jgi:hypothetical protein
MTLDSREARASVERAAEAARNDDRERIAGSATQEAVQRTLAMQRRSGWRRFAFENGLVLAATALFLVSFAGQVATGHAVYNADQRAHAQPTVGLGAYLTTGNFLEATAENWESEFLQMGVFVVLTAYLFQKGSSESKTIEAPDAVDQRPEEGRADPAAPWPVRRGGIALRLYEHSLSISLFMLFAVSLSLHAVGGAAAYSAEQLRHGEPAVSAVGYMATSQFWFESFQNWQSEFLSVAVLVLLSIFLRERGSSQSKPVAAPHSDTGE